MIKKQSPMDKIQLIQDARNLIKVKEQTLINMTNQFCTEHLDDDYQQLCEILIKKMGRKHDVPFKRGKLEV